MKRAVIILIAALLACTMFYSCGKEGTSSTPQVDFPTLSSLVGTEWEGSYLSPIEFQGNSITMKLVWTVDFLTDTTGSLLVEISSQFSQTEYNEFAFSYTYDGDTEGHIYTGGEEEPFSVDPLNQTITINMQLPVGLGDETEQAILGGVTTLYRLI